VDLGVALVPRIFKLVWFLGDGLLCEAMNLDEVEQVLISLDVRHAENILNGQKDIELRTRKMNLGSRTRVWIYVKKPLAAVVGFALLKDTIQMTPRELWKTLGDRTGISATEFFEYFADRQYAHALLLESPFRLSDPLSLAHLRAAQVDFSPPQFFKRLGGSNDTLGFLLQRLIPSGPP